MQYNHLFIAKMSKALPKVNPNDDALQPQSSLAEYSRFVWGAEQNLLLIAENIIQIIFLIWITAHKYNCFIS